MEELVYALGDLFQWTFGILETLGNKPNYAFIVLIMFLLGLWMVTQQRYLKEDRANDRLI